MTSEAEYEAKTRSELAAWQAEVTRAPGAWDKATRGLQDRINAMIPEKVHQVVTATIENLTRGILTGSDWTTAKPLVTATLEEREAEVARRIEVYRATAAVEGGVAGAGGFVMAAAEFPVLLTTKIKLLFEIAALYGHDVRTLPERLHILSIFQLAFSSAQHRAEVFETLRDWDQKSHPTDMEDFDWRRFQQQYRDYIDLAKLAQLIPVIGAPVGAVVNYRLLDKLGKAATGAYRMRWFS